MQVRYAIFQLAGNWRKLPFNAFLIPGIWALRKTRPNRFLNCLTVRLFIAPAKPPKTNYYSGVQITPLPAKRFKKSIGKSQQEFSGHLKKTLFNASHDIRIKGYEVEVFIQDSNEKEKSTGSYSLVSDTWIRKPEKESFEIDEKKYFKLLTR